MNWKIFLLELALEIMKRVNEQLKKGVPVGAAGTVATAQVKQTESCCNALDAAIAECDRLKAACDPNDNSEPPDVDGGDDEPPDTNEDEGVPQATPKAGRKKG